MEEWKKGVTTKLGMMEHRLLQTIDGTNIQATKSHGFFKAHSSAPLPLAASGRFSFSFYQFMAIIFSVFVVTRLLLRSQTTVSITLE